MNIYSWLWISSITATFLSYHWIELVNCASITNAFKECSFIHNVNKKHRSISILIYISDPYLLHTHLQRKQIHVYTFCGSLCHRDYPFLQPHPQGYHSLLTKTVRHQAIVKLSDPWRAVSLRQCLLVTTGWQLNTGLELVSPTNDSHNKRM